MRSGQSNPILTTVELGQSLWLDFIRRDLVTSGELSRLIAAGEVRGVTSNPTIFEQAIKGSADYLAAIRPLAHAGWEAERTLDTLVIEDIQAAADEFLPLYEATRGADGYVSIEVNPELAFDSDKTLREARRLWADVSRPNLMVKIPATAAGVPAIEQAIAAGINVNITLIFSLERYAQVIEAYLSGLETRRAQGLPLAPVASVASFFVSRVDTAVDALLEAMVRQEGPQAPEAAALRGKAAVANAKLAYAQFRAAFGEARFRTLAEHGARLQRPLWASTGTKNPAYPDTYYVDMLIGPDTVNTVPPQTLDAFRDHGRAEPTLETDLSAARAHLDALAGLGIDMRAVTTKLEAEGVEKFAQSFRSLLDAVRTQAQACRKELGPLQAAVQETLAEIERDRVGPRLWDGDPTLWSDSPGEAQGIRNRLGWLRLPDEMAEALSAWTAFASDVHESGITKAVLLGMGGSSLAADVMGRMVRGASGLGFEVLDSTDPAAVLRVSRSAPLGKTLFIVSSKSGTTTEPLALLEYFWQRVCHRFRKNAGRYFVAITDPGTPLERLARDRGFRMIFSGPPSVGGRYSALSVFGLVPAALLGVDLEGMVLGARQSARACGQAIEPPRNPGLYLGAVLGAAGQTGRIRLTFFADGNLEPFLPWAEQLIAESSGKKGKGLVPLIGEPPGTRRSYGDDRLLIYLRDKGDLDRKVRSLARAGVPVLILQAGSTAAMIAGEFFRWEVAVATACHRIGVNPFDEPDVKTAKDRTAALLEARRDGRAPVLPPVLWDRDGIMVLGRAEAIPSSAGSSLEGVIRHWRRRLEPDGIVTFLVYQPKQGKWLQALKRVRRKSLLHLRLATAAGIGPRYLHSTGQIHKGGPSGGLYVILTAPPGKDVEVPGYGMTFGDLEHAQAMGDLQALLDAGRTAYAIQDTRETDVCRLLEAIEKAVEGA